MYNNNANKFIYYFPSLQSFSELHVYIFQN